MQRIIALFSILVYFSCNILPASAAQSFDKPYWDDLVIGLQGLVPEMDRQCGKVAAAGRNDLYNTVSCRNQKIQSYLDSRLFPYPDLTRQYLNEAGGAALEFDDGELSKQALQDRLSAVEQNFITGVTERAEQSANEASENATAEGVGKFLAALVVIAGAVLLTYAACKNGGCNGGGQSYSSAHSGCCSHHGGWSGACGRRGMTLCNDGWESQAPSCTCP
jgi:hypothetical protein